MKYKLYISLCLSSLSALAWTSPTSPTPSPRPLVLWHGLGDSHSSPGMLEFIAKIKDIHSGIFVHSIYIKEDLDEDRRAGFYGNVDEQVEVVAEQIAGIEELRGGFDAIGFSQGGQFLRAYVERHNHDSPPIHNLITFGSQHMGVSDIPTCKPGDILCQLARRITNNAVYSTWVQTNLIQAQYFRDPANLPTYLASNRFLTSINNEVPSTRNVTYAHNLATLDTLVLVMFEQDKTVVPKESAWFGSEAVPADDSRSGPDEFKIDSYPQTAQTPLNSESPIIPMHLQPLYIEDWIGLRTLDKRGAVVFETCAGEHMYIGDCWEGLVRKFVGAHA